MNKKSFLYALPVLCLVACGSPTTDDANDSAGTASPYLAKEVVGVHTLSTDVRYNETCEYLGEEIIRSTFAIKEDAELMTHDEPNGCEYHWGKNHVSIAMTGEHPFASIFKAEYVFNKMVQGGGADTHGDEAKGADLHGQAAEGETMSHEAEAKAETGQKAKNDTASTISGVTAAAAKLTEPAHDTEMGEAVAGIGDKAIWEHAKHTLHVLNNNHIMHVTVGTADSDKIKISRAVALAKVALDRINHQLPD
jgi:hypothetical protein